MRASSDDIPATPWQLALLGPVRLARGGQPQALPTHKLAALLVLLALGGPAPRSRVAAWLWPDLDDTAARRNLRRELARLREAGAGALLRGDDPQLLALAAGVACDAALLAAAVADSPLPQALDSALAAWRGPPADGLVLDGCPAFADWLQGERTRLLALRHRALERRAALHEAAGQPAHALPLLEQRAAEDPLHEPAHRALMQLHLRQGRAAAALAQYTRCRDALQRELGLAPSPETEALARLARPGGDAGAAPATVAPAWPPPGAHAGGNPGLLPLSGRDDAWAALAAAWQTRRPVLIEGVAGIGKTRLACEFAAAQGAYALAPCRPGDAAQPYVSFKRALRLLAGPALEAAELPAWVRTELAHLLPELGPASARPITPEDRSRLQEAAVVAWRQLAGGSFDAVLVDDWHLADSDSRTLFGALAAAEGDAADDAPRLVLMLRPELDADGEAALRRLRSAGAHHLVLAPLDEAQLLSLVQRASGAREPLRFTRRLQAATGGNPFFVAEVLAHWRALGLLEVDAEGRWRTPFDDATDDYRELPLPASVRDAVLARVQRLPAPVQALLQAAALAAEPFAAPLLASACAQAEAEVLAGLGTALGAGLLRELGDGHAFAHDLMQVAVASSLAPGQARLLHRRLALGAEAAGLPPAEIARHWEAGGEPRRAAPHRLAAAEAAALLGSWDSAEHHWRAVLGAGPEPVHHVAVLRMRWPGLKVRDDRAALQAVADELQALITRWQRQPEAARAAVEARLELAQLLSLGVGVHSDATALALVEAIEPALEPDDPLHPRLALAKAQALNTAGRHDEAEQAVEAALARGLPALTPRLQAQLLHTLTYSHFARGQPQRALPFAERTLRVWQAAGDRRMLGRSWANVGLMRSAIGDQPPAIEALEQALAIARELRLHELHREAANNLADIRLMHGQAAAARALADEALSLAADWVLPQQQVYLLGMRVQAAWQLGELGAAWRDADTALAIALQPAFGDRLNALMDTLSMSLDLFSFVGDFAEADRRLALLDARDGPRAEHFEIKLAFNRVRLALARGDVAAARAALARWPDPAALHEQRDREHAVLCQAEIAEAAGEAGTAAAWLARHPAPEAHVEVAARRARLALALDPGDPAAVARAREAAAAATTPRPSALDLQLALARAGAGAGHADAAQALLQRLVGSLAGQAGAAARLRQRWT